MNNRKGFRLSNRIFSAVLFVFSIYVGYAFSLSFGASPNMVQYYSVLFIVSQSAFLIGPLLFWYVKSVMLPEFYLQKTDILHLFPFLLAVSYFMIVTNFMKIMVPWESKMRVIDSILIFSHIFIYLMASIRLMQFRFKSIFYNDDPKIAWLRFLVIGYVLIWLIQLHLFIFIDIWKLYGFCPYSDSLYFAVIFIFCNGIAFIAWNKPELFAHKKKYQTSELLNQDKERYLETLRHYMEDRKAFLEPSLTLAMVSEDTFIPIRYLSQIINEFYQMNFCDYLNRYRVEEGKLILSAKNKEKTTILQIAFDVGFNSKSTFNTAFKKHTGMTPSEYIKRNH